MTTIYSLAILAATAAACSMVLSILALRRPHAPREVESCRTMLEELRKDITAAGEEITRMEGRIRETGQGMRLSETDRRKITRVIKLHDMLDRDGFWQPYSTGRGRHEKR